jgi:hypothetical protein
MAEQPLSSDHETALAPSAPAQRAPPEMPRARRWPWSGITIVRLAVLLAAGFIVVLFATQWDRWVGLSVRQVTDDAYVRGDITPLSAHVEGYVHRVPVDDFQRVKGGEVLVKMEDDDHGGARQHCAPRGLCAGLHRRVLADCLGFAAGYSAGASAAPAAAEPANSIARSLMNFVADPGWTTRSSKQP